MKRLLTLLLGFILLLNVPMKADEGMWLLPLLKKLNIEDMQKKGFKLSAEDIYSINQASLKDAIVIFGGGCTGELISDQGLILTNHHCGYGAIQQHSTVENDYLKDGFWAMSKEEEIPTPGLRVTFLKYIKDVSEEINAELNDEMTEDERAQKINEISTKIEDEAKADNEYTARVQSFFEGNQFFLLVYEVFPDVRMVGAPPSSIGKFGADTDNWMWPRHTGDFSLFRVYADENGKPAEYAPDNKPLKPKHHLPVSLKGVENGDFTMIMGYPGGTDRYMTSWGVKETMEIINPTRIDVRTVKQDIMMKDMKADEKVRIQYASKYSRSSNYWKYSIGQNKGLKRLKVIEKKEMTEKDFRNWVNEKPERKEKYGETLELIKNAYENRRPYQQSMAYMQEAFFRGPEIVMFSGILSDLVQMMDSEEDNKEAVAKEIESIKERASEFYKDYNAPTDKKILAALFELFEDRVKAEHHPAIIKTIEEEFDGDYKAYAAYVFDNSIFASQDKLNAFLDDPKKEVVENDPAFKAMMDIRSKYFEIMQSYREYAQNLNKGKRLFMDGLMQMQEDKKFYPDANFTMRLTYGEVGDYYPKDAVHYNYYTTLKGVMEKEDPNDDEFIVPEKLKELYKTKDYGPYGEDDVMKLGFISDNDITGGNSGSPVMNGNGELIGLAFDGNWEAMSGDIAFEPELQRTISVDIRYVLFVIDKFAGAGHLVEEMTLVE